jgi:branched-chain amino acid transport system permease protein
MLDNLQLLFVYAPVMNVQMILDGIFIGAVFALAAYGLALVWGVMNVKNLAQGDFVIMGGYLAFTANNMGFPPHFGTTVDCSAYVLLRSGGLQAGYPAGH